MNAAVQVAFRVTLLLLALANAFSARPAHGIERPGDAVYVHELQQDAAAMSALHLEFLHLLETAPSEDLFSLYWTYDLLMGTWTQVEFLQRLLDLSIAAASPSDEAALRTSLRDQAQFAIWDLDQANSQLGERMAEARRPVQMPINLASRLFLSKVRNTVSLLLASRPT